MRTGSTQSTKTAFSKSHDRLLVSALLRRIDIKAQRRTEAL